MDFSGRAQRSEYWWFVLFVFVVSWMSVLFIENSDPEGTEGVGVFFGIWVVLLLPYLSVGVRRLHDTGRSGGYLFISLIPLVGTILLIVWLASKGDLGPNRYGEAPAAP